MLADDAVLHAPSELCMAPWTLIVAGVPELLTAVLVAQGTVDVCDMIRTHTHPLVVLVRGFRRKRGSGVVLLSFSSGLGRDWSEIRRRDWVLMTQEPGIIQPVVGHQDMVPMGLEHSLKKPIEPPVECGATEASGQNRVLLPGTVNSLSGRIVLALAEHLSVEGVILLSLGLDGTLV